MLSSPDREGKAWEDAAGHRSGATRDADIVGLRRAEGTPHRGCHVCAEQLTPHCAHQRHRRGRTSQIHSPALIACTIASATVAHQSQSRIQQPLLSGASSCHAMEQQPAHLTLSMETSSEILPSSDSSLTSLLHANIGQLKPAVLLQLTMKPLLWKLCTHKAVLK